MEKISIGNDIVDLNAKEPELHPRFIDRVFSQQEKNYIRKDLKKLWLFWSAKEAAYKATKRLIPSTLFSPIKFEYDPNLKLVSHKNLLLHCEHIITTDYVYTFCTTQPELLNQNVTHNWIEKGSEENIILSDTEKSASIYVREIATKNISQLLKISHSDIKIPTSSAKNKDSIPRLFIKELESQDLISFSHHGKFVACFFLHKTKT